MAAGEGARSTLGLPWQLMQRPWNTANPDSVPADCGAGLAGGWPCAFATPKPVSRADINNELILFMVCAKSPAPVPVREKGHYSEGEVLGLAPQFYVDVDTLALG